jgi:hypothetical protein
VTVNIEIKFTKSKAKEATGVQVTGDPNAFMRVFSGNTGCE